jgi:hypothetical protein
MPSPDAGATTPAASPANTTFRPSSQRFSGCSGIGAPSRRIVSTPSNPERARSAPTAPRSPKPFCMEPVPTLAVSPWGKIQA